MKSMISLEFHMYLLPDGSVSGPVIPQILGEEQFLWSPGCGLAFGVRILNKSCILNEGATKCATQTAQMFGFPK